MTRVEMKAVEIILDIYVSTFGHFNTHFLVVKDQRLSTFMCLPLVANQTRLFSIRFNSQNCLWSHNRSTSELEMLTIGSYALSLHVPSCYNQIWPFQICSLLHGYFFHPKKNSTCPSRKACTRVGSRSVTLEATIVSLVALSCWT